MPAKKPVIAKKSAIAAPATQITGQQQSNFRTFIIVTIVVTILVVVAGGYAIYQLSRANIQKNDEIRAQDAFLSLARHKNEQLDDSKDVMAELKKTNGDKPSAYDLVTKRALPSKSDFESVINIMNKLQNQSLVTVQTITLESSSAADTSASTGTAPTVSPGAQAAQALPIGVKITGGYDSIQDFFKRIESSVRVFDFQTMKLTTSSTDNTLDMKYKTYYISEPNLDGKKVSLPDYEKAISVNKDTYK